MKRLLITGAFLLTFSLLKAQNTPASTDSVAKVGKPTGRMFTDSMGKIYDVFQDKREGYFVIRVNKKGEAHKQYIHPNLATQKVVQAPNPEQLAADRK